MELVGSATARGVADVGPARPAERVADIAAQAAAGLAVAHETGHRPPGHQAGQSAPGRGRHPEDRRLRHRPLHGRPVGSAHRDRAESSVPACTSRPNAPWGRRRDRPATCTRSAVCSINSSPGTRRSAPTPRSRSSRLGRRPGPPRELGVALPPAFENYLLGLLAKRPEDRPTARQAADWFAAGAWRGRPEPLPATVPEPRHAPVPAAEPPALPRGRRARRRRTSSRPRPGRRTVARPIGSGCRRRRTANVLRAEDTASGRR